MSDLPSPSKSPTPAIFQLRSATAATERSLFTVPPFMIQSWSCPVSALRHRMSDLPSPSKSPTPAIFQFRSVVGRNGPDMTEARLVNKAEFSPAELLPHSSSAFLPPSTSVLPAVIQQLD